MSRITTYFLHLFIPRESNNYKAKSLQVDFLSLYLIAALLFVFTAKNAGTYMNNVLGFATDITAGKLLELTNQERAKQSLTPLTLNPTLSQAAEYKAQDMFQKNYWAHFSPGGTSPWDFIVKSGYRYEYAGENLAKNFLFSQGVVDAWMNSTTHRDNVLKKEYSEVGFAIVNGILNGEETTLVVQMFGAPIIAEKTPEVKEQAQETKPAQQPALQKPEPVVKGGDVQKVLSSTNSRPRINLLYFTVDATYIFMFLFSLILIADLYVASKLQIIRTGGKPLAHLIFIGFIFVAVALILRTGSII